MQHSIAHTKRQTAKSTAWRRRLSTQQISGPELEEMHLPSVPLLLGSGERLWEGLDEAPAGV